MYIESQTITDKNKLKLVILSLYSQCMVTALTSFHGFSADGAFNERACETIATADRAVVKTTIRLNQTIASNRLHIPKAITVVACKIL